MAKTYKQLMESLNKKESVVVAFNSISNLQSEFTSNKLTEHKHIVYTDESQTVLHSLKQLCSFGYKEVSILVESKWTSSYESLLEKYNGHLFNFDKMTVIPTEDLVEDKTLEQQDIREAYVSNLIYNVGEFVLEHSTGLPAEIIDRGSNYVRIVNQLGEVKRCWLNSISKLNVSEVFIEHEDFYKGNRILVKDELLEELHKTISESTDVYKNIQEVNSVNFLDTPYNTFIDQTRVAKLFATVLGITVNLPQDPKTCVNLALLKLPGLVLSPKGWDMVSTFLMQIDSLGIKYNKSYLNAIKQHLKPALFAGIKESVPDMDHDNDIDTDDIDAFYSKKLDQFETDLEFLEDEINNVSFDDVLDYYTDDELCVDNGDGTSNEIKVNEDISRQERFARSIRFKRIQPILQAKRMIAMRKVSTPEKTKARARRMAVAMIRNKLLHGQSGNISITEKARIENLIHQRAALISRTTNKLLPKIKKIETQRLIRR